MKLLYTLILLLLSCSTEPEDCVDDGCGICAGSGYNEDEIFCFDINFLQDLKKLNPNIVDEDIFSIGTQSWEDGRLISFALNDSTVDILPESIYYLRKLEGLFLGGNNIITLPNGITNLLNLKKLYLIGNQITSLPDNLGNLSNLNSLALDGNKLTNLPESITNLINIDFLLLGNNNLTQLPDFCNSAFGDSCSFSPVSIFVGGNHLCDGDYQPCSKVEIHFEASWFTDVYNNEGPSGIYEYHVDSGQSLILQEYNPQVCP